VFGLSRRGANAWQGQERRLIESDLTPEGGEGSCSADPIIVLGTTVPLRLLRLVVQSAME
jgi:hypothetical protein